MNRLLNATRNTWNGLVVATRGEVAFRQELVVLVLAVPLAFVISHAAWTRLALIASILLVLVAELLNSAIEKLSDVVSPAHDIRIGQVKDLGSAAVGMAILIAALVWLLAFCEKIAEVTRAA